MRAVTSPQERTMTHPRAARSGTTGLFRGPIALTSALLLLPAVAQAHFQLQSPASSMSQDVLGSPQKLGPCGDEGGGTATGTVTPYHPGDTVTVMVNELIYHPGHYRIALSVNDRSELPAEPAVTPNSTPCGTAAIESPVTFPVLADDVFDHSAPFSTPQSIDIQLPTNVTCTKCTLQIIEFMSNHPLNNPGGCFYHHCADISIQTTGPTAADGGFTITADGGTSSTGGASKAAHAGCACSAGGAGDGAVIANLLLIGAGWTRRRTRRQ
jgi:MYXO-CTERM domain-containing protein